MEQVLGNLKWIFEFITFRNWDRLEEKPASDQYLGSSDYMQGPYVWCWNAEGSGRTLIGSFRKDPQRVTIRENWDVWGSLTSPTFQDWFLSAPTDSWCSHHRQKSGLDGPKGHSDVLMTSTTGHAKVLFVTHSLLCVMSCPKINH